MQWREQYLRRSALFGDVVTDQGKQVDIERLGSLSARHVFTNHSDFLHVLPLRKLLQFIRLGTQAYHECRPHQESGWAL
jgi:hypothetical protein